MSKKPEAPVTTTEEQVKTEETNNTEGGETYKTKHQHPQ